MEVLWKVSLHGMGKQGVCGHDVGRGEGEHTRGRHEGVLPSESAKKHKLKDGRGGAREL